MSHKFTSLSNRLYNYLASHTAPPDQILQDLAEETQRMGFESRMQVSPDQGAFLTILTKLIDAKLAIEIGTFTGYSGISIARGLSDQGHLITCEVNEAYAGIATKYFERAGLNEVVTLKLGPALETLENLNVQDIDLVFIDADKVSYQKYYEAILPKVRQNGLIIFDNVLWHGAVVSPWFKDANTKAIRALNDFLVQDNRVKVVMVPVSDGMTLARKR